MSGSRIAILCAGLFFLLPLVGTGVYLGITRFREISAGTAAFMKRNWSEIVGLCAILAVFLKRNWSEIVGLCAILAFFLILLAIVFPPS